MGLRTLSARAFAIILPVALLLFGLSTWWAYSDAREREIESSRQLLARDRALAQQALEVRFDGIALAHQRVRERMLNGLADGPTSRLDFDTLFPRQADGTRRSTDALWDGTQTSLGEARGFGAFISEQDLAPDRRRTLSAAFSAMVGLVEGLPANVNNLYFFSPDNDLIMFAPTRTDNLAFYRREAPADLDFQDEEFSQIVTPRANPDASLRCTSLQPILYDETRQTWTTGCMTPVRTDAQQLGAFGSSIPLDEIFTEEDNSTAADIARVIVTADGRLIRHPEYTIQYTRRTQDFLDLASTSNPQLRELWDALRSSGAEGFEGYLPNSDIYLDMRKLDRPEWYVVSMIPGAAVRERAFIAARPILFTGFLATAVFALFIVIFIRRQLTSPVEKLARRADAVSLDNHPGEVDAPGEGDEISRLNRAFDEMEKRVARERIRLTRSFDMLVDAIEEYAILLLDPQGNVTRANRAAKEVFQWKEGAGLEQIDSAETEGFLTPTAVLDRVVIEGRISQSSKRRRGDGREFWAFEAIEAIRDAKEELVGFAYIARDMTAQKQAEADLLAARDNAEREAENRKELLATMSHEIRTPMTGIVGMLEQVRTDNSARSRDRALASIESSAEALMRVVDDVLQHARAESGAMAIEERPFDPTEVVHNSAELFAPLAKKKGLSLKVQPGIRDCLIGDPVRIQQILANFLSNAIKFTETGTVTVACEITRARGALVEVAFRVEDTGIGVSSDRIASLFEPFEQASPATEREFGGTGLGLSICRKLAEAMGGTVSARSTAGEGSTFTLRLELRQAVEGKAELPGRGKSALVLSSKATTRIEAEAALEELGFEAICPAGGGIQRIDDSYSLILFEPQADTIGGLQTVESSATLAVISGTDDHDLDLPTITLPITAEKIRSVLARDGA